MRRRRPLLVLGAVLAATLAACSAGPESGSSTPASPTVSSSPSATGVPSEVPDLERLLPDVIGGEITRKASMTGQSLIETSSADQTFIDFIDRLGVASADVGVAYAIADGMQVQAVAYRVAGVETGILLDELQASVGTDQAGAEVTWEDVELEGRSVRRGTAAGATDASIYLYGHEDIVFIIIAADPELAGGVAAGLP